MSLAATRLESFGEFLRIRRSHKEHGEMYVLRLRLRVIESFIYKQQDVILATAYRGINDTGYRSHHGSHTYVLLTHDQSDASVIYMYVASCDPKFAPTLTLSMSCRLSCSSFYAMLSESYSVGKTIIH